MVILIFRKDFGPELLTCMLLIASRDACACSFCIERVYRKSEAVGGGPPRPVHEASFDIVWDVRAHDDADAASTHGTFGCVGT